MATKEPDPCEKGKPANVEIEFHISCASADSGAKGGKPSGGLDGPATVCYSFKLTGMDSEYRNCVSLKGNKPPPGADTADLMQAIADQLGEAMRGSQIPSDPHRAVVMFQKYGTVQDPQGKNQDIEIQNGKIVLTGATCADAYSDNGKVMFGLGIEGTDPGFVIRAAPGTVPPGEYRGSDAKGAKEADKPPKPPESSLRKRTNRIWDPDHPGVELQPGDPRPAIYRLPVDGAIGTIRLICETTRSRDSDGIGSVLVPFLYRDQLGEQRGELLDRLSASGIEFDVHGEWVFPTATADGRLIRGLKFSTANDPTGGFGAFPWHVYVGNRNARPMQRESALGVHLVKAALTAPILLSNRLVEQGRYRAPTGLFDSFVVPEIVEGHRIVAKTTPALRDTPPVTDGSCSDCGAREIKNPAP